MNNRGNCFYENLFFSEGTCLHHLHYCLEQYPSLGDGCRCGRYDAVPGKQLQLTVAVITNIRNCAGFLQITQSVRPFRDSDTCVYFLSLATLILFQKICKLCNILQISQGTTQYHPLHTTSRRWSNTLQKINADASITKCRWSLRPQ